ncbi:MAG: hypothetical protein Q4E34_00355 [Synergistaceae bacterium]|nr:hypothetical protein [Synergistaceae bacterium]
MFLQQLNETQKRQFLTFAMHIASIDNDFSSDEEAMLVLYCNEMNIPYNRQQIAEFNQIKIQEFKSNSSIKERKIFILELVGLAMCDNNFDTKEREFLETLAVAFDVPISFISECEDCINKYLEIQSKMISLVL